MNKKKQTQISLFVKNENNNYKRIKLFVELIFAHICVFKFVFSAICFRVLKYY